MAIDPLLEEREDGEEVTCHGEPDEPDERPVLCLAEPEEPDERPVLCLAEPGEEEEEVEEEIVIIEPEPPAGLAERWRTKAGEAGDGDFERLWTELTEFLRACSSGRQPLRPPSAGVDDLWHEFILFTREYHAFCDRLGGYVHHVPEVPAAS